MPRTTANNWLRTCVAILSLGFLSFPVASASAQDETLETVFAAWRKREAEIRSAKFVIAEDYLIGEGTHGPGQPPRDVETKKHVVIVLDGGNMRHERVGEVWGTRGPEHTAWTAVIDGPLAKDLSQTTRNDDEVHPTGTIANKDRHIDVTSAHLRPALWHFRPLSPRFGIFDVPALTIVSRAEMVDGTRCILLEEPTKAAGRKFKYWVAPDKQMSVIRAVLATGDTVTHQWDITYARDPKHGWLPARWKTISLKYGVTRSAGNSSVVSRDINLVVPAGTFDIEFPPGVDVSDRIQKKRYIVKPDGTNRMVMQRELARGATYTQLVNSEEGSLGQNPASAGGLGLRMSVIIGVVSVSVVVLIVFVRTRHWSTR